MPKCDLCEDMASHDAPTENGGPWAFLCQSHYKNRQAFTKGTKLKLETKSADATGQECGGRLVSGNMLSSVVTIACEDCGEERRMEPDSDHYTCNGCGASVSYCVMDATMDGEGDDFDY